MFKNPFSFSGRIRRTEFGLSVLLCVLGYFLCYLLSSISAAILQIQLGSYSFVFWLFFLPVLYFITAQGVKRCHDMGHSGWYHLIPFYCFRQLFKEGDSCINKFGTNPKELGNFETLTRLENTH
ncbi:hypothetical protein I215_04495 [Galbibacter marinus]|uniref:DUF805 domain-containing protein n=1 Tax=Galbibacter marinus TaxID=555500 RepID=K2Q5U3_9FLAO|nr:hypothetical protein I215_04495 [Galbibacter marinus]